VLWCCWLGGRKGIRPVKKLSGGRSQMQVGCCDNERGWTQSRTLNNTGFHRCDRWTLPGISRTVICRITSTALLLVANIFSSETDIKNYYIIHELQTCPESQVCSRKITCLTHLFDNLTVSTAGMSFVGTATASPLQVTEHAFCSRQSRMTFSPS